MSSVAPLMQGGAVDFACNPGVALPTTAATIAKAKVPGLRLRSGIPAGWL